MQVHVGMFMVCIYVFRPGHGMPSLFAKGITALGFHTWLPRGHMLMVRYTWWHLMTHITSYNQRMYSGNGLYFLFVVLTRYSFTLLPLLSRDLRR